MQVCVPRNSPPMWSIWIRSKTQFRARHTHKQFERPLEAGMETVRSSVVSGWVRAVDRREAGLKH